MYQHEVSSFAGLSLAAKEESRSKRQRVRVATDAGSTPHPAKRQQRPAAQADDEREGADVSDTAKLILSKLSEMVRNVPPIQVLNW